MSEEKRLTMERIEEIRPADSWMSFWRTPVITIELRQLCDLALSALSQEAVRDEVLAEVILVCDAYASEGDKTAKEYVHETVAELAARFRALKREPNAAAPLANRQDLINAHLEGRSHLLNGTGKIGDAPAPAAPDVVRQWEWPVNTVGKLITNLQTLPPEMSFYTAYFVEIDGAKIARVSHPSLSRETIFDWKVQKYSPNEQSLVMWATPLPPAPGRAPSGVVMVPMEPTRETILAINAAYWQLEEQTEIIGQGRASVDEHARTLYRAMLSACEEKK